MEAFFGQIQVGMPDRCKIKFHQNHANVNYFESALVQTRNLPAQN